ncbi:hypothetical protein PR202_gb13889 [Eleusine coracana subsp. coracana]|uniref:RRM domain-containing protein n=1 Tax=Eleusine coracana subsp. coracana TaxID=191504 RepID=A0AAV5ET68_ELECO|nr:hypothetical protein PR202_gb13889 [Eleusine coracana subsp. coracana]
MERNYDSVGHLQEEHSAAVGYDEGSEEDEPYECEFCDDDDEEPCEDPVPKQDKVNEERPCHGPAVPENVDTSDEEPFEMELCSDEGDGEHDSLHSEPHTNRVPSSQNICRKRLYEVEPCHDLKKEQNNRHPNQDLRCTNYVQEDVLMQGEKETKPFKKRLSVKFAADVSCYTYNSESFAAAKLEKKKAQVDDQEKHLCKGSEQPVSLPQDDGRLKKGDATNLFVGNLPPSVSSHKLIELFLPFGRIVRSRVMDDCFTGLSKGYGFVKYADPRSAAEAIKRMNGRTVTGNMLEVRVADAPSSGSKSYVNDVSVTDHQPRKEMGLSDLYVSNLPLHMNTDMLLDLFKPYGQVTSAKVARDYTTGLSKGYGFVKYSDPRDAAYAVVQLNGCLFEGKKIEVRVSGIPLRQSSSLVPSHGSSRTMKEIDMTNLYVSNIPTSMNSKKLVELFLPFGKITHARIMEKTNNSCKGYGFIKFEDSQSAAEAVALMNGTLIEGETILVRVAGLSQSASSSVLPDSSPSVTNSTLEINRSRLYITDFPQSMTAEKLINLFMRFGQINKVVMKSEYTLVYYADVLAATEAIKHLDGYLIEGKRLVVKGSQPTPTIAEDHASSQSCSQPMKEIDMANLYVGGVPLAVTCDQLVELFRPFGEIVQARKFHSRWYGMIRYANPSSAAAAIDHMHGYQIGGSTLVVRVAGLPGESKAATNTPTVQMVAGNQQRQIDMANLYVCHLPPYVTTEKLIELFLPCGQITEAKVVVDKVTGVSKGFGFVKFADTHSAAVALTHYNGYPLDGHVLEVRIANVPRSEMISYMAQVYSHFTSLDPSQMAVGVPTSYWPYYYAQSTYATPAEYQGQATEPATAAYQTSQQDGLPESNSVGSIAEKDSSCVSNPIASDHSQLESWTGPPGFEPNAVRKGDAAVTNPPRDHSRSAGWAGPPGFEPHAVKKEAIVMR